jgi:hypothetical protein
VSAGVTRAIVALVWLALACSTPPAASAQSAPRPSGGVGIAINQTADGHIVVADLMPAGPGASAGLRVGDVIVRVDDQAVSGLPLADVARKIAGQPGTQVTLDVKHPDGREAKLTIVRQLLGASPRADAPPSAGDTPRDSPGQRRPADRSRGSDTVRLKTVRVGDEVIGGDAFHILVPVEWRTEGGVRWQLNPINCASPATFVFHAFNPAGAEELWVLPNPTFSWAPGGIPFFPEGSFYLGNEVRPPVADPIQYIRMYVIPRFRSELGQARIIAAQPLPELAQAVAVAQAPGLRQRLSAGRVSVEFPQQGRLMQEDLYTVLVFNEFASGVWWLPHTTFSFKAEKGRLEAEARLFRAMITSLAPDLKWYNRYLQFVDVCTQSQIHASNQAVVRSQIISRTNDEINTIRRQAWQNQQAARDRMAEKFDNYIRGVERYQNPFEGRRVDLPSGYDHAWVNARGEYILSNSPSFNPNIGSTADWRDMKK